MKKFILFASALLLFAQGAKSQESFKHLSLGLDAATTGVGLQVAVPVVTDHLILAVGYNFADFSGKAEDTLWEMNEFNGKINQFVADGNAYLSQVGDSRRLAEMPNSTTWNGSAKIRFGTFKAIFEYYPAKKKGFHINAGIYAGSKSVFSMDGSMPEYWSAYNANVAVAKAVAQDHPEFSSLIGQMPELKATINDRTFEIRDDGNVNIALEAAAVRPYLGLGFGRSFPDSHFGFQFDFGAMYIGKLRFTSTNETTGPASITVSDGDLKRVLDTIGKICVLPQMSFRLIYKIF